MAPDDTDRSPCPIATMDAFGREFLAGCHAEAHERAVQAGLESSPCAYCGRDYEWHVREGVYGESNQSRVATRSLCNAGTLLSICAR